MIVILTNINIKDTICTKIWLGVLYNILTNPNLSDQIWG
jgi:hypothetical protein